MASLEVYNACPLDPTMQNLFNGFPPTDVQGPTRSRRFVLDVFKEQIPLSHLKRWDLGQKHNLFDFNFPACKTG